MNIGFDAKRIVSNGTGLGSYGRTFVNGLVSTGQGLQLHLYAPTEGRSELKSQVAGSAEVRFHYPTTLVGRHLGGWWRSRGVLSDLKRDGIDLYHGLSGELPVGISRSGVRSVVTIHDLIFLRHPEYYHWADVKIYAWKFRQAVREADRIIAISECTRRDIIELGGVDDRRISLIYQSCASRFRAETNPERLRAVRQRYGLPDRYLLSVGSIEARKNILLAVKALHRLPKSVELVVVGRHTAYTEQVLDYARRNGLAQAVHVLHNVPNEDLPSIYAQAEVFVYPSRYEGFGIPIIEAVSCGLPVVACTGSCLEEAGGPDCLYVGPDDDEAMAAAVGQVLAGSAGREERIRRSQDYIRRFAGTDVAGQAIDLYRSLL